ncbi:MAG: tetratricopeptide repeat protein [Candidatus Wallbacteria bacterium]|nr:tetratricopeptide repeat protein [Candidatus Wallbacteria bacterium]
MNLLPSKPFFCGRANDLKELKRAIPERNVLIIAGIGGIGKTALLLQLAYDLLEEPGRGENLIWVSSKSGWNDDDLFSEIVQKIAQLSGDKKYTSGFKGAPAEIIGMLEDLSLILFLDDFHLVENEHTRGLITAGSESLKSGKIIIATRKRLSLAPLELIEIYQRKIEGLEDSDASDLMDNLLRSQGLKTLTEEKKGRIFQKTKGHPFSLKLFFSLLITGRHSLESLLSESSGFLDEMDKFLFHKLWENLTEAERQVLCRLSILRIPVSADRFPLFDRSDLAAACRLLIEKYLIETDSEGRVHLHDLLREYAALQLPEDSRRKFHEQVALHFFNQNELNVSEMKESYYHYWEAGDKKKAIDVIIRISRQFLLIAEDSENFLPHLNDAINFCENYREQELMETKAQILIEVGKSEEALSLLQKIVDQRAFHYLRAYLHYQKGEDRQALDDALAALSSDGGETLIPEIKHLIGVIYFFLGESGKAEENCLEALKMAGDQKLTFLVSRTLIDLGNTRARMGKLQEALDNFREAEQILRSHNLISQLSKLLISAANLCLELQDYGMARKCVSEVIGIALDSKKYYRNLIYCYGISGDIDFAARDFESAYRNYSEALRLIELYKYYCVKLELMGYQGRALACLGRLDEAEEVFGRAFKIMNDDSPYIRNIFLEEYAQFLLMRGKPEALARFQEVRDFARQSSYQELLLKSLFFISKILKTSGSREADDCGREFRMKMEEASQAVRNRLKTFFQWFDEQSADYKTGGFVLSRKGRAQITDSEIRKLQGGEFEIFIDFINRDLSVDGQKIGIFKKRILVPLITALACRPGRIMKPSEISALVWNKEYDPETDSQTLRKNVSRLREMLGDGKGERFILAGPEKGSYLFNDKVNFCVIISGTLDSDRK